MLNNEAAPPQKNLHSPETSDVKLFENTVFVDVISYDGSYGIRVRPQASVWCFIRNGRERFRHWHTGTRTFVSELEIELMQL